MPSIIKSSQIIYNEHIIYTLKVAGILYSNRSIISNGFKQKQIRLLILHVLKAVDEFNNADNATLNFHWHTDDGPGGKGNHPIDVSCKTIVILYIVDKQSFTGMCNASSNTLANLQAYLL